MFCKYCGKQVKEGAAFCGNCGKAVPKINVGGASSTGGTNSGVSKPTPSYNYNDEEEDSGGVLKIVLIVIGVVAVVALIIFLLIHFVLKKEPDDMETSYQTSSAQSTMQQDSTSSSNNNYDNGDYYASDDETDSDEDTYDYDSDDTYEEDTYEEDTYVEDDTEDYEEEEEPEEEVYEEEESTSAEEVVEGYIHNFDIAMREQDISYIAPYMKKNSPIYKAQASYVQSGIYESLEDYEILWTDEISDKVCQVRASETYYVTSDDGADKYMTQKATYKLKKVNGEWKMVDFVGKVDVEYSE